MESLSRAPFKGTGSVQNFLRMSGARKAALPVHLSGAPSQRGQVSVELALVFVLLLLIAMSIAEVARALLNVHQLTQAAREGARAASLTPALNSETGQARVQSRIEKVLQLMGKNLEDVRIDIATADIGGDATPDVVDVQLQENFQQITPIPFIPGLNNLILQATISMPLFSPQDNPDADNG